MKPSSRDRLFAALWTLAIAKAITHQYPKDNDARRIVIFINGLFSDLSIEEYGAIGMLEEVLDQVAGVH